MKERPILFSGAMVRALLDGSKTQTRREVTWRNSLFDGGRWPNWAGERNQKPNTRFRWGSAWGDDGPSPAGNAGPYLKLPFASNDDETIHRVYPAWQVGDHLWVREAWRTELRNDAIRPRDLRVGAPTYYEAGGGGEEAIPECAGKLRPGIFMLRWASRITLSVTEVRVQRLQNISEEDAKAEGIREMRGGAGVYVSREGPANLVTPWPTAKEAFADLWESINGAGSWEANPWVWAISFRTEQAKQEAAWPRKPSASPPSSTKPATVSSCCWAIDTLPTWRK